MKFFKNPDCLPLEDLKLNIKNDGVIIAVNALNVNWAEKRYLLHYEPPEIYNDDGSEIMGAKDHWVEVVTYIIKDLNWLLSLPFYRFWSNILYNTSIIDTLVSFLQEAPPFYALENFPNIPEMLEALETLHRTVLLIFARLVTNKENSTEYMNRQFLGNLLYDNYIFTIPIIFDLCQLYGRENAKVVEKIVHNIFSLQPLYNDDLQKSVPCLIEALKNVERRFEDWSADATETITTSQKESSLIEMTLHNLEDLILYVLDVSSTLNVLLKTFSPIITIFHREDFTNKIVSLYGNTIPQMYKKLDKLAYNDENMPKYIELKHRLDVARVEMLSLYRIIIYEPILNIQEKRDMITETEIRHCIDEYLNLLINAISEKEFIIDYHQFYSIDFDLEIVSKLSPDVDTIKCEYILHSLRALIGDSKIQSTACFSDTTEAVAGPSGIQNNQLKEHCNDINYINNKIKSVSQDSDKLMTCISEVKEILCGYGEGFIELCLKHYDYDVASVIDAVFGEALPSNLKELDITLPYMPPDPIQPSATIDLANGVQRLNVFDKDESDIMTQHIIDTSRIYKGKKKEKYNNIHELLNDKSELKASRSIYEKFGIIDDDYDDEYDDTYDGHNIRASDDSTEIDSRPFITSKRLCSNDKDDNSPENNADEKSIQNDHFVQNPADLRAKAEQRRQLAQRNKNGYVDVAGKSRDQRQNKDDQSNRHKKNVYKSTQGKHNRRKGSAMKRAQGMMPS